jgi:hypothetical protein
MKHIAIALTIFALAGTPVVAQEDVDRSAPPPDVAATVMPNDPNAPTVVIVPAPEPRKNTGASNPDTPDPTKNTPGAESKN